MVSGLTIPAVHLEPVKAPGLSCGSAMTKVYQQRLPSLLRGLFPGLTSCMMAFLMLDSIISVKDAVMNGYKMLICRLSTLSCDAIGIALPVVKLVMLHGRTFLCFLNGRHLSAISQRQVSLVEHVHTLRC